MNYAHVVSGAVEKVGGLPSAVQRPDTGQWVSNFFDADQTLREACGWFPVTEVRPALGTDQVHGTPTFTVNAHDVTATYPVVADSAANIARRAQDAAVANLLAGATALRNDLAAQATALNTAAATLTTALNGTNLPANPSAAQLRTAILAIGAYLTANKTAVVAVGSDLDATIKGLGNFIAKATGSTTVLS